jgi:hypothetical protein
VAKFFASPFTSTNIDTAIRDFQNIVSNPKNSFYSHCSTHNYNQGNKGTLPFRIREIDKE